MAAGRDIARATRLIRKRQETENARALAEEEARRTEAEALAKMKPSEIRRLQASIRRDQRAEAKMIGSGFMEDKMDRGEGAEDKAGVGAPRKPTEAPDSPSSSPEATSVGEANVTREEPTTVATFASSEARELAETFGLGEEELGQFDPSSKRGFTAADVREIKAVLDEEQKEGM